MAYPKNFDLIAARQIARQENMRVHVLCGGQVTPETAQYSGARFDWCHGCDRIVPQSDTVTPDEAREHVVDDVQALIDALDDTERSGGAQ